MTDAEFKKLINIYEGAKKRPSVSIPSDKDISLSMEFKKSNLTSSEFAKQNGLSYWKFDTILNRVARYRFLNK